MYDIDNMKNKTNQDKSTGNSKKNVNSILNALNGGEDNNSFTEHGTTLSGLLTNHSEVAKFQNKNKLYETFKSDPTCNSCIKVIATEVASTEFNVKKLSLNGDAETIPRHPFLDTLYCPNANLTKTSFVEVITTQYLIFGQVFLRYIFQTTQQADGKVKEDRNKLIGFEPISPLNITIEIADDNKIKYVHRSRTGDETTFTNETMLYLNNPSATSHLAPISPMISLAPINIITEQARDYQLGGFTGGDIPATSYFTFHDAESSQLILDKEVLEGTKKNLKKVANVGRAREIPILVAGELKSLRSTPHELDFLETLKTYEELKKRTFGVPNIKLGGGDSTNRATAEVLNEVFTTNQVEPIVKVFVEKIQKEVIERFYDFNYRLDYDLANKKSQESNINNVIALFNAGVITDTEAREELGYGGEPVRDEDGRIVDIKNGAKKGNDFTRNTMWALISNETEGGIKKTNAIKDAKKQKKQARKMVKISTSLKTDTQEQIEKKKDKKKKK